MVCRDQPQFQVDQHDHIVNQEGAETVEIHSVRRREDRWIAEPHCVRKVVDHHGVVDAQSHPTAEELPLQLSILHILLVQFRAAVDEM